MRPEKVILPKTTLASSGKTQKAGFGKNFLFKHQTIHKNILKIRTGRQFDVFDSVG
jgi:hypothetical protein